MMPQAGSFNRQLIGREHELDLLEGLLSRVRRQGTALMVRGEAGIGKSALLAHTKIKGASDGFQVLSATGIQSEAQLAFAGLHQLLRPLLPEAERLPQPQRTALSVAFGMSDSAAPELFLIALASLNLLVDAAEHAPILLVIEDTQWLDRPSCDVLTFIGRRLEADPIVMSAAIREEFETSLDEAQLPVLNLAPLETTAAHELLESVAPTLSPWRREMVLTEAAGNPLAIIELSLGPKSTKRQDSPGDRPRYLRLPLPPTIRNAASRATGGGHSP